MPISIDVTKKQLANFLDSFRRMNQKVSETPDPNHPEITNFYHGDRMIAESLPTIKQYKIIYYIN